MNRYASIHTNMPREFLLLQGTGCKWKKCSFCDYYTDTSDDPFATNLPILNQVTGQYGVLDIINSGSAMELDPQTLEAIKQVAIQKHIHTLWFEAHYMYRNRFKAFAQYFAPIHVKFRCGVESFDPKMRARWNKGIPEDVTPQMIAQHFQGVCLLCCTQDDTKERILNDIAIAQQYFEYFSVNLFCNNSTHETRNEELAAWFEQQLYPQLKDQPGIEVLLNKVDLGVGD